MYLFVSAINARTDDMIIDALKQVTEDVAYKAMKTGETKDVFRIAGTQARKAVNLGEDIGATIAGELEQKPTGRVAIVKRDTEILKKKLTADLMHVKQIYSIGVDASRDVAGGFIKTVSGVKLYERTQKLIKDFIDAFIVAVVHGTYYEALFSGGQ